MCHCVTHQHHPIWEHAAYTDALHNQHDHAVPTKYTVKIIVFGTAKLCNPQGSQRPMGDAVNVKGTASSAL
jgi:hypothetical protein